MGVSQVLPYIPLNETFMLPLPITVGVFHGFVAMILASGSVMFFYGHVKFNSFLSAEKEKYHILSKHGHKVRKFVF